MMMLLIWLGAMCVMAGFGWLVDPAAPSRKHRICQGVLLVCGGMMFGVGGMGRIGQSPEKLPVTPAMIQAPIHTVSESVTLAEDMLITGLANELIPAQPDLGRYARNYLQDVINAELLKSLPEGWTERYAQILDSRWPELQRETKKIVRRVLTKDQLRLPLIDLPDAKRLELRREVSVLLSRIGSEAGEQAERELRTSL